MLSSALTRYANRDDAFSAANCLECASPRWMNLRTWIAWEIWYHRLTDRPNARDQPPAYPGPTIACGRRWSAQGMQVLDREADWSTAPVKGHFDEFHNQLLTHWHRCQIADLFISRNITSLTTNCPKLHFASSVLRFHGLEIFVVEFVL